MLGLTAFSNAYRIEQRANRKQEATEDKRSRSIEKWTLEFVILTTIGIFIQASILNSSDEAIHKSAGAAKDAADAAKRAVEISALANRAWISPLVAKLVEPLDEDKPVAAIAVTTQNVGKEPALGTVSMGLIDVAPQDQIRDRKLCEGLSPAPGQATMFPSERFGGTLSYGAEFKDKPNAIRDVISGRQILYVTGCIAYETAAKPHHTGYCFYLYPEIGPATGTLRPKPVNEWVFRGCPVANYAD